MPEGSSLVLIRQLPEPVVAAASRLGITGADCLFCVRADLDHTGKARDVWLVVTQKVLVAFAADGVEGTPLTGPFEIAATEKVRTFQTVGGAILQVMRDGFYSNVLRYSNSRREIFGRARQQLERLVDGRPLQLESLSAPSDLVCATCALPLPGRGAACPRCSQHAGLMRRSLALMKPYTGRIAMMVIMMVAGVSLDLLPPLLTKVLVDDVLKERAHVNWLEWILLILVTTATLRGLLNVLIGRTSVTVGTQISKALREQLQAKLMRLSVDYYDRHAVGSLMSRVLYDTEYFQGFVHQVAQGFLVNVMLVLGIGSMLFFMNWQLALLVLLPIPFVVTGTIFFWKRIYPRYYRLWDSQSKMAQLLSGFLSGIRLVKTFGQEERERERFTQAAQYIRQARVTVETSTATFNPIMAFVFSLGGLLIWEAGGHSVLEDRISLGTLMAFLGYVGMFYGPISAISMFSNWVTGFLSSAQRVFEILDAQVTLSVPKNPKPLPDLRGAIEFRNVTFGYDPYVPVLKNVSFKIEAGQFVGIVGKSGSGKTTVVNLVCRFYDPQEGEVFIDGVNVRDVDTHDLHRQVALVLQEPFLFRGSISENIAYGRPGAAPVAIMDAARNANAHEFVCKRHAAYDTRLGERGAGLSGGERQRISIARALLCEPKVLILDEATSSVDTESEQEIQKALAVLCKGRTTIAIAHRLSTLKSADHILVIDEGRVAESGTHDALMTKQDGIYHKLVMIQTQLTRLEM